MLLSKYVEEVIKRRGDLLKDTIPVDLQESTLQFIKTLQEGQMAWRKEEAESIRSELEKTGEIIRCYLESN